MALGRDADFIGNDNTEEGRLAESYQRIQHFGKGMVDSQEPGVTEAAGPHE